MSFMFENLQLYQEAVDLAERISMITDSFPRGSLFLSDTLNRAARAIATNLAEGDGRITKVYVNPLPVPFE